MEKYMTRMRFSIDNLKAIGLEAWKSVTCNLPCGIREKIIRVIAL